MAYSNSLKVGVTLSVILLIRAFSPLSAQSGDADVAGKIIYFEGRVEVSNEDSWVPARMNAPVHSNQAIRTPGDGMAEILWASGSKTVVGPNSAHRIGELNGINASSATKNESLLGNFKRIFAESAESGRKEEGGIRRDRAEVLITGEEESVYWKQDDEISFEEAASVYESGNYAKAISAIHAFLQQKPEHEKAPFAWFALGHSYLEVNNSVKAKEVFEDFVLRYPESKLIADAKAILSEL